jgi:hypothetical protein
MLFLAALWVQNGSPWLTGYSRYNQYIAENGFRFTTFRQSDVTTVAGFDFSHIGSAIARTAVGMFRLNFDLLGWPSSFAFLLLALPGCSKRNDLLWWMVGSYLSLMLFQRDWGIDTFGPVHAFELALPVVVLTIVGAKNLSERLSWAVADVQSLRWRWSVFSPSLLGALIATALLGFVPVRLRAVSQIAAHINLALRAPERASLHHAIIFAPLPFAPLCTTVPAHFVFFHPVNDPDLHNDILWVNDVDPESDRNLLASQPDRTGYVLRWNPMCDVSLVPLSTPSPPKT